jgi:hypothetical protein
MRPFVFAATSSMQEYQFPKQAKCGQEQADLQTKVEDGWELSGHQN